MIRSFNGKTPRIADSAFVSEAAYVIGDVEIGENSGIWPCAVVRGDGAKIRIGSNTHVEDNSVLHSGSPMEIGDNVIIGHGVVMHGKRIGNTVLVGNNATILDDVEIGDFCVIGAGCVVREGMKVPNNSLVVGVPGKIKGEVSPEQLQWIEKGIQIYTRRASNYKQQGL